MEVKTYVSEVIGDWELELERLCCWDKEIVEVLDAIPDFVPLGEVVEVFEVDIDLVGVLVFKGVLLAFIVPEFEIEILVDLVPWSVIVPNGLAVIVLDCDTDFVPLGEDEELLEISELDVIVDDKE